MALCHIVIEQAWRIHFALCVLRRHGMKSLSGAFENSFGTSNGTCKFIWPLALFIKVLNKNWLVDLQC